MTVTHREARSEFLSHNLNHSNQIILLYRRYFSDPVITHAEIHEAVFIQETFMTQSIAITWESLIISLEQGWCTTRRLWSPE